MLLLETVAKEERHRTYGNDVCFYICGVDKIMTFDEFQEFARKNWSMSVKQVRLTTIVDECGLDVNDECWEKATAGIVVEIIPL